MADKYSGLTNPQIFSHQIREVLDDELEVHLDKPHAKLSELLLLQICRNTGPKQGLRPQKPSKIVQQVKKAVGKVAKPSTKSEKPTKSKKKK